MKFLNNTEYQILPIPFTVFTLCGTWCPENYSDREKRAYKFFTVIILVFGIILFIEMFVMIIITSGTERFNLENVFATIVFIVGLFKKVNILYYQPKIVDFIRLYANNQCYRPKNLTEALIDLKIQFEIRWVTIVYAIFIGVSIFLRASMPILESGTLIVLPLDVWYPYSVDNFFAFWLTYCHQIISGITLSCMHLSTDTLFVGLLLQIIRQLDILKHRLTQFGNLFPVMYKIELNEYNKQLLNTSIGHRIREHESIFRFACELQKTFKPLLVGQMVVVIPSLIINIYFLSIYSDRLNSKYFMTIFFVMVSLMQIYMFCWYGNEILLGSLDVGNALYECNWIALNECTKRTLLTIITRTSKIISISAGTIIPLNINSYIKIMKASYSAFNLLQRTAST